MRMAGIQVRFWMAAMRFILSWLLAFFVALAGVINAADDQQDFQRRLFERYDGKNVVSVLGLCWDLTSRKVFRPTSASNIPTSTNPSPFLKTIGSRSNWTNVPSAIPTPWLPRWSASFPEKDSTSPSSIPLVMALSSIWSRLPSPGLGGHPGQEKRSFLA